MSTSWFHSLVAWIAMHPIASGGVIAGVVFVDAMAVVGTIMPTAALLLAIGAMAGLGHFNGFYAIGCAASGALLGDGLNYWIGWRWGPRLREVWPFRRHPQVLDRGEALFNKRGALALVVGRYLGVLRPFVPPIAGMLRMPLRTFLPTAAVAGISWAALSVAAGWWFGAA